MIAYNEVTVYLFQRKLYRAKEREAISKKK